MNVQREGHGSQERGAFSCYDRLDRVRVYVELEYPRKITLSSAAGVAGLEKTYFSKFFGQKTGMHFRDWLAQVRVEHAKEFLKASNLTIAEIALRVGCGSARTLERHFRRYEGSTPKDFRATARPQYRFTGGSRAARQTTGQPAQTASGGIYCSPSADSGPDP